MRLILYTDATSVGGAEIAAGHLTAALDPAIEVEVFGVDHLVVDAIASRRPGAGVMTLPVPDGRTDLRALGSHVRALRRRAPDLVQVNLQTPWVAELGITAAMLAGYPVIAVEHLPYPTPSRVKRRVRRVLCGRLAAHVAVGERAARLTEEVIGLPAGSVQAIFNGVPDQAPSQTAPGTEATIGAIGRLVPQKGFDVLLRALARLRGDVTCSVIGDGEARTALERLALDLGLENRVSFNGWVERPRDRLPGFRLVAVPSRLEGLGLVAIEAALAERPVVASAVEGLPDVVEDPDTGILVPPDDPVALADAIATLLSDPQRAAAIGRRARERALQRFSLERMAGSYEDLYRDVLGARR